MLLVELIESLKTVKIILHAIICDFSVINHLCCWSVYVLWCNSKLLNLAKYYCYL